MEAYGPVALVFDVPIRGNRCFLVILVIFKVLGKESWELTVKSNGGEHLLKRRRPCVEVKVRNQRSKQEIYICESICICAKNSGK